MSLGSENRKRQRVVTIRLSDRELEALQGKAEKVEMTVPGFLRELALKQAVRSPLIDREGAIEIGKQIRAIGNNLNQLTRYAHEGKPIEGLHEMRKELHDLRLQLSSLIQKAQTDSSTTARKRQRNVTE